MKKIVRSVKQKYEKFKPYMYIGNLIVFLIKVILFFITLSWILLISSFYNLGIGLARKKVFSKNNNYISIGIFVSLASLFFILYSIWIIVDHKIVNYNLYVGILIATVTFYDIGHSIYGIVKSIKHNNSQNNLLMLVNLATGIISLELTQAALLSFTQIGVDNSLHNGLLGIVVGVCAFLIGILICLKQKEKKI